MKKIKNVEDIKQISGQIIGNLVNGNLTYFALTVSDSTGFSACFFTPTSQIRQERKNMIFVQDYDKILMLLLSHPRVSDIEYDESENMLSAIFNNPLAEEYDHDEAEDYDGEFDAP